MASGILDPNSAPIALQALLAPQLPVAAAEAGLAAAARVVCVRSGPLELGPTAGGAAVLVVANAGAWQRQRRRALS